MLLVLIAVALLASPEPIVGRASVIDGDTLEIRDQRIRLWGIDAPEGRQTCANASGRYRCGQEAANHLSEIIGQNNVRCEPVGRPDRYRRVVARCSVSWSDSGTPDRNVLSIELGQEMVKAGWALEYPRYSDGRYSELQAAAGRDRRGLWTGAFQTPWEWRSR